MKKQPYEGKWYLIKTNQILYQLGPKSGTARTVSLDTFIMDLLKQGLSSDEIVAYIKAHVVSL